MATRLPPTPWRALPFTSNPRLYSVLDAEGNTIAEILSRHGDYDHGPLARFLAAAPELVEALEIVLGISDCQAVGIALASGDIANLQTARELVARVRGEG